MTKLNNAFSIKDSMITANSINDLKFINGVNGTNGIFMQKNEKYINNSPTSMRIEP
jgi:hypothetical protein